MQQFEYYAKPLWDRQSSPRTLQSLGCLPFSSLTKKNVQFDCNSSPFFWALACYEQPHSFSAAAADLICINLHCPRWSDSKLLNKKEQTCCINRHVRLQTSGIIGQGIIRQHNSFLPPALLPLSLSWLGIPGVLWLCIVAESLYLTLLFMGGALMILELCPCFSIMNKLKLSAFAAMCTALSGIAEKMREEKK